MPILKDTPMRSSLALLTALLLAPMAELHADDIDLVRDGKTDFCIVQPAMSSKVDGYAVARLADYLKEITGAEFPVVEAKAVGDRGHCLFVGISPAVVKRLGCNPLETLKDQEHVSLSRGGDVFLYGKGVHGNLHAVMEFLEGPGQIKGDRFIYS